MTPPPGIEIEPTADRDRWTRLLTAAGRSPLEQGWAYGAAVARRHRQAVERLIVRVDGRDCAMVQSFVRPVLGAVRLHRIVRGPVWTADQPDEAVLGRVLRALAAHVAPRWRDPLLFLPELADTPENHALMRGAGLRRVVTGYSSAWLDLSLGTARLRRGLHGKWRNALNAAERSLLVVEPCADAASLDALLARYDRFRRARRFVGQPGGFIRALTDEAGDDDRVIGLAATADGAPAAGIVLVRHGAAATYLAGWTGPEGRRLDAHNLLLWRGIEALDRSGTRWLDLGGIGASAPGVARFKLGVGAGFFTLAGTYM